MCICVSVCHEYGNAHSHFLSASHGRKIVNLPCHDVSCQEANYSVVYGVSVKLPRNGLQLYNLRLCWVVCTMQLVSGTEKMHLEMYTLGIITKSSVAFIHLIIFHMDFI